MGIGTLSVIATVVGLSQAHATPEHVLSGTAAAFPKENYEHDERLRFGSSPTKGRSQAVQEIERSVVAGQSKSLVTASFGLEYDANLNGGIPGSMISISGIDFMVAPQFQARKGLASVVSLTSRIDWPTSVQAAVSGQLTGRFSFAPKQRIAKADITLELCAVREYGREWFSDACVAQYANFRALGEFSQTRAGIGVGRLWQDYTGIQIFSFKPQLELADASRRMMAEISWRRQKSQDEFLAVSGTLGARPERTMGVLRAIEMTVGFNFLEHPTTFTARRDTLSGETIFGRDRVDDRTLLLIRQNIHEAGELEIGLERRHSTIETFSGAIALFSTNFRF